ncbi:hypothetical protein [Pseudonocardia sp. DSM 110487]|nr:hypothetical protein [Pseudonocardia sp. DSM 110487]
MAARPHDEPEHLLREYDRTPPLWPDRQTTRGYSVQARVASTGTT